MKKKTIKVKMKIWGEKKLNIKLWKRTIKEEKIFSTRRSPIEKDKKHTIGHLKDEPQICLMYLFN